MLYFSHSFLICTLLFLLITSVALSQSGATMTRCIWIKYPDINKCILSVASPEVLCYDVKMGTILWVSCSACAWTVHPLVAVGMVQFHVSVRSCAVVSWSSLCLIEGRPPQAQLRACSLVYCLPQTQFDGRCGGRHPYMRHRTSLKAPSHTL